MTHFLSIVHTLLHNWLVRLIDLVSHITCVVCVKCIYKYWDLQFKVDSER